MPAVQKLELLDPRPDLDLPAPGAAVLLQRGPVGLGDGVGVEQAVGRIVAAPAARRSGCRRRSRNARHGCPWADSSRAIDCASPRSANLPMAKVAESAKPFTPAVAPVSKIAPCDLRQHAPAPPAGRPGSRRRR